MPRTPIRIAAIANMVVTPPKRRGTQAGCRVSARDVARCQQRFELDGFNGSYRGRPASARAGRRPPKRSDRKRHRDFRSVARLGPRHQIGGCARVRSNAHTNPRDRRHVRQAVRRADGPAVLSRHARARDARPRPLPARRHGRDRHDGRQPRSRRRRPPAHRRSLPRRRRNRRIVVTHGTDTMVETARALAAAGLRDRTIVLTGAMVPYAFGSSDGLFNLGSALSFAQVLPPGVYVAMNGQYFAWDRVRKNRENGIFEATRMIRLDTKLPSVGTTIFTVMSRLAAGARRDQPVAGLSGLRLRSGARRRRRRAHAERQESVRADAGRRAAARGHRGEVRVVLRPALRSRDRSHRHVRRHRGDLRRRGGLGRAPATRSSCSSRATTRTCRRSS